jgi:hypothetical protein
VPTARTQPEPPFGRPPHPELQLLPSGASEPVDARFELAPLDDGQLERVEVARLQELKIGHLHHKGCIPTAGSGARNRARGAAMRLPIGDERRAAPSSFRLPIGDFSHCAWEGSLGGGFGSGYRLHAKLMQRFTERARDVGDAARNRAVILEAHRSHNGEVASEPRRRRPAHCESEAST